jgi:hypothetical protein
MPLRPMKLSLLSRALRSICSVTTMFVSIQMLFDYLSKRPSDRMPESLDPNLSSGAMLDDFCPSAWALTGLAIQRPMSNEVISTKNSTTQCAMCFSFLVQ